MDQEIPLPKPEKSEKPDMNIHSMGSRKSQLNIMSMEAQSVLRLISFTKLDSHGKKLHIVKYVDYASEKIRSMWTSAAELRLDGVMLNNVR